MLLWSQRYGTSPIYDYERGKNLCETQLIGEKLMPLNLVNLSMLETFTIRSWKFWI